MRRQLIGTQVDTHWSAGTGTSHCFHGFSDNPSHASTADRACSDSGLSRDGVTDTWRVFRFPDDDWNPVRKLPVGALYRPLGAVELADELGAGQREPSRFTSRLARIANRRFQRTSHAMRRRVPAPRAFAPTRWVWRRAVSVPRGRIAAGTPPDATPFQMRATNTFSEKSQMLGRRAADASSDGSLHGADFGRYFVGHYYGLALRRFELIGSDRKAPDAKP
jgi:hypothetical protein